MRRPVEGGLVGRAPVKARRGPASIVEGEVPADRGAGRADGIVGVQIDFLVLDRAPQPLNDPKGRVSEQVVAPRAPASMPMAGAASGQGAAPNTPAARSRLTPSRP